MKKSAISFLILVIFYCVGLTEAVASEKEYVINFGRLMEARSSSAFAAVYHTSGEMLFFSPVSLTGGNATVTVPENIYQNMGKAKLFAISQSTFRPLYQAGENYTVTPKTDSIKEGYYYLQNKNDAYLAYDKNSGNLILSGEAQTWYLKQAEEGGFWVQDAETQSLMFDLFNAWYFNGNRVGMYYYTGYLCQQWTFDFAEDGFAYITSFENPEYRLKSASDQFIIEDALSNLSDNDRWHLISVENPILPVPSDDSELFDFAERDGRFNFSRRAFYEPNPEYRMAHNIYVDPDLSYTSGRFTAFSIEFEADHMPANTYWALCNWSMDTSNLDEIYKVTDRGGAYAGLQSWSDGTGAIMSFWQIKYLDEMGQERIVRAKRVYPAGEEHAFDGEGEGTNYITSYDWKKGNWYRMLLRCYDDADGITMVEQWILDMSVGQWTLMSRFNTGLYHSCFLGGMSQFMENYDSATCCEFRSFRYRNLWVREYGRIAWTPLDTATLSIDTWYGNKKGTYAFGATDDFFWGMTCGAGEDAAEKENHGPVVETLQVKTFEYPTEIAA